MLRSFNKVRYTQSGSDMYYVGGGGNAHYLGPLVVVGWSTVSKGPFPDGLGFWVDSRPTRPEQLLPPGTNSLGYYYCTWHTSWQKARNNSAIPHPVTRQLSSLATGPRLIFSSLFQTTRPARTTSGFAWDAPLALPFQHHHHHHHHSNLHLHTLVQVKQDLLERLAGHEVNDVNTSLVAHG